MLSAQDEYPELSPATLMTRAPARAVQKFSALARIRIQNYCRNTGQNPSSVMNTIYMDNRYMHSFCTTKIIRHILGTIILKYYGDCESHGPEE